uniref:Uncharacterized protein n=1 Tax=Oryza sativa subsp. japonica TaxID=39947 RepID=Q7XEP8_ORYSJ|nr:hypothetical protein LOC_Os10g27250 [Oryza sativa Japonica Group]
MDISRSLFRRIASRDDNCSDKQKGKYDDIDELKDVAQVDKQLERYQRDTLRAIRPQQVYCMGFFENKNGLYRISREVELSVLTKPVELKIVAKEFENSLKYSGYKYIHQDKLRDIADEYNNSMKSEWPKIRDKELYFYRELSRIKKQKKEKSLVIETPRTQEIKIEQIKSEEPREEIQKLDKVLSEEEQWEVNEKLLLESYEEENNLIEEIENIEEEDNAEQYNDFIDSLDEEGLHNLDNAMEAMEVDLGIGKRKRYGEGSVKNEGERERPARAAGRWPPEKEEYSYHYIPGQYRHMGTKRRDFEKPIKFQNQKSDGAILNLAAHDPIDWPNIISIWKGLIVQKYIQNQHNIGNKVGDMITYLETFLGESAKVLWEQWVEKNPNNYEELKRAGSNPHNFANIVSNIIIAEDPELGYTTLQNERLKEIEKLTLTSWKDEITIRNLSMISDDMIIGLRFLQQSVQTTVIHEQGITFIPYQNNWRWQAACQSICTLDTIEIREVTESSSQETASLCPKKKKKKVISKGQRKKEKRKRDLKGPYSFSIGLGRNTVYPITLLSPRNNLSTKKITEIAPAALMVGGKLTWQTVGRPRRLPPSAKIAIRPLPPIQRAARG